MDGVERAHLVSPDVVRVLIRDPCLVAVGQCPTKVDDRWADRVGVLDVASRPRVLFDAWMYRESVSELGRTPLDGWDVMFATSWRWAWGGAPFSVWSRRGWVTRVNGHGRAVVRTLGFERQHEVQRVRVEISKGWLTHRVGLSTRAGKTIWVARRTEVGGLLDATYDGSNLLADARWASVLGSRLADALHVPFETNTIE